MPTTKTRLKLSGLAYFLIVLAAVISFTAAIFWAVPHITLESAINPGDLISSCVTLIAAVWVATIIDTENNVNLKRKEIILSRVEKLSLLISESRNEISMEKILYTEAASSFKKISVTAGKILEICELVPINIDNNLKTKLFTQIDSLTDLVTNTPQNSTDLQASADIPISVREGYLKLRKDRLLEIDSNFIKLNNLVFELEISIIN